MVEPYKTLIIGSGPAGHTAAIYAARANLEPVMYEGMMAGGIAPGGQLTTTGLLENFPGFPEGIMGQDFTDAIRAQSAKLGTDIRTETVTRVDTTQRPFRIWVEDADGPDAPPAAVTHSLIVSTGATARRLHVPGSEEYWQKGISACAVCDGALPMFRNQSVAVVGGGDSACEEALHLTKFASMVHILHRRAELRASKIMQSRVLGSPKITVHWDVALDSCFGEKLLTGIKLKHLKTGEITDLPVRGLFFAIGHTPNTGFLKNTGLEFDPDGYIKTVPGTTYTAVEGLFAAGDCQDRRYRQAVTAAGTGCMAALDCERWLSEKGLA